MYIKSPELCLIHELLRDHRIGAAGLYIMLALGRSQVRSSTINVEQYETSEIDGRTE